MFMRKYISVFFSVTAAVMVVALVGYAATTISTNITTGGTLTVSGASTLTGLGTFTGGFVSQASSSVGTTLGVGGLSTFGGFISTASSTAGAAFTTAGLSTFEAGAISRASSTVVGAFNVTGTTGVATNTPGTTFSVGGDARMGSRTSTTTLFLNSFAGGSCIQFNDVSASTTYRLFVNSNATSTDSTGGGAESVISTLGLDNLVLQLGACKN